MELSAILSSGPLLAATPAAARLDLVTGWAVELGVPVEQGCAALDRRVREAETLLQGAVLAVYDRLRITQVLDRAPGRPHLVPDVLAQILTRGPAAFAPSKWPQQLPTLFGPHDLDPFPRTRLGVEVGRGAYAEMNRAYAGRSVWLGPDHLRTSALVAAPPGSGKTASLGLPVTEGLVHASLAGLASCLVIDPKGDDYAKPGWFDYEIDLRPGNRTDGFDLYGGARSPDMAADRLGSALLPESDPRTDFFIDSAKNRLYAALSLFHTAHGRYPSLTDLLNFLTEPTNGRVQQSVHDKLKTHGRPVEKALAWEWEVLRRQASRREDPAQGLVERLGRFHRPHLLHIFDRARERFTMGMLNQPVRVRLALDEHGSPDASTMIGRLALAQWVQVTTSPTCNRGIFKGLIAEEASTYIGRYVANGVKTVRSNNAGMLLIVQQLIDIDERYRLTVFGSCGGKGVFGGIGPDDADLFSRALGDYERTRHSYQTGNSTSEGTSRRAFDLGGGSQEHAASARSRTESASREPRWSYGDIQGLPRRHCLLTLTSSDGTRDPDPVLVDLTRPPRLP